MSFGSDLDKFAKQAEGNMQLVLRKVTYEIAKGLIEMSPVDTGRFRANWMVGIGSPNSYVNNQKTNAGNTLNLALARTSLAEIGKPVFITNSLPYAQRLEYGWSKQAPGGMVRITAARFDKIVSLATTGLK